MKANRHIIAHRCGNGCLWLYQHDDCPDCGGPLSAIRISSDAVVISNTVVRVNPTGTPIHLGVAKTTAGATTLCIVHGWIRGHGRDRVRLVSVDGRFHALARGSRLENKR